MSDVSEGALATKEQQRKACLAESEAVSTKWNVVDRLLLFQVHFCMLFRVFLVLSDEKRLFFGVDERRGHWSTPPTISRLEL